ncbi:MAG: hypothetical protein IPN46_20005 [Saprospiraceae bacterium]|nr:hypothetical protein [Saprospiraceae bacterium]
MRSGIVLFFVAILVTHTKMLLTPEHIAIGINGKSWIYTSRQKNDNVSNVPLFEPAIEIIEKYKDHPLCV